MMNPNRSRPRYLRRLMVAQACALFAVTSIWAQQVAQPAATNEPTNPQPAARPVTPTTAPAAASASEEVVKMSPFEVRSSERDIGYYAENTLAGSRLNTNVGDLAAAITIVTKQQLVDTGSVNINDVFMYEANTEGAATYTPIFLNRSNARDTIGGFADDTGLSLTVATANRVRGLGAADTATNNYPTSARVMFDTYNTQTVEIARGPNSLLFGIGSPAGIVNQSTAEAILNKRKTEVSYRLGSWGSFRGTIAHNQPLVDDKLAISVALLYDSVGYQRKPSYDLTRRQFAALTYQPFGNAKTKISANFENYDNKNERPNGLMPRDYVTPWLQAGRPAYNSVTRMLTVLDTGRVVGPYVSDTRSPGWIAGTIPGAPPTVAMTSTTSPQFVPGIQFDAGRTVQLIDEGTLVGFWNQNPSGVTINQPAAAARTAAQWLVYDIRPTYSNNLLPLPVPNVPVKNGYAGSYSTWYIPGITDKSIYDYTKLNLLAPNYGTLTQKQYNIEFQQEILSNLHFDAGWFRQEIAEVTNYTLGQSNQQFSTWVDTNLVLPDGTPNPYFGSPFEFDTQGDTFERPEINNNYRAMLAYEQDFTKNSGWTKWLGRHRLLGLWSEQRDITNNLRYRLSFDGGDTRFLPNTATSPANNFNFGTSGNVRRWYYEGKGSNGLVTFSPGFWGVPGRGALPTNPNTGTIKTYNWTTAGWEDASVHFDSNLIYAGGNYGITDKIIASRNFAWQGYLWDDRVVPTFGWRRDNVKIRTTNFAGLSNIQEYVAGFAIPGLVNRMSNWTYYAGNTKTEGVVVRPYLKWLSFHFNKSDNFNPPSVINVDYLGNVRPKPVGQGKDWGASVSLFDNKLVATLNWFKSAQQYALATNASTATGRVSRMDTSSFRSWAEYVVRIRSGENPMDPLFANASARPLNGAQQDAIAAIMGVPYTWPAFANGGSINGTQENKADGLEAQIIYNPMPNWNIKFTLGKQKSTYDQVAPEIDDWLYGSNAINPNGRLAFWQAAAAPDMPALTLFQGNPGRQLSLQHFWTGYGFNADVYLENATSTNPTWTSPQGFYDAAVGPEIATAKALQGNQVPNERSWSWSLISTYAFQTGKLKGLAVGGGVRWADRAIAGYYGDFAHTNSTNAVASPDITRPIYTPSETHYDAWIRYSTKIPKIFGERINVTFQLNVYDFTEGKARLEAVNFNYDGSPAGYRIIDPRRFAFTTTLDF